MRLTGGAAWLDLKRRFMLNPFDFLKLGSGEADGDIVRADLVISKLSSPHGQVYGRCTRAR